MDKLKIFMLGGVLAMLVFALLSLPGVRNSVLPTTCGSTSALSITKAEVTTSSNLDGKQVLRVYAKAEGNGECLKINWDKTLLQSELAENNIKATVDKSVTGDFSKLNQRQTFAIYKNTGKVYNYGELQKGKNTFECINACSDISTITGQSYGFRSGSLFSYDCYCPVFSPTGQDAAFGDTVSREFDVQYVIDGLGRTTLTESSPSGRISDKAFIRYEGDLVGSKWLQKPSYDVLYAYNSNSWTMIAPGTYNNYLTNFNIFRSSGIDIDKYGKQFGAMNYLSYDDARARIQKYNVDITGLISNKESEFLSRNTIIASTEKAGNQLTVDLDYPISYPTFIIELDAGWVGIHRVEGVPDLDCSTLGKFTLDSGNTRTQSFIVKNLGSASERATFSLAVDCNQVGSADLQTNSISITGGASQTVRVTSSGLSNSGTQSASCTITATDINSLQKDTCTYSFSVKEITTDCTESMCMGSELWECVSGEYRIIPCEYGCDSRTLLCSQPGKEICDDGLDNDADGKIDMNDPECQNQIDFKAILPYFLGAIAGLGFMAFSYMKWLKKKKDGVLTGIYIVMALAIGIGSYFLSAMFVDFLFSLWGAVTIIVLLLGAFFIMRVTK
jgi:hypothetical protein